VLARSLDDVYRVLRGGDTFGFDTENHGMGDDVNALKAKLTGFSLANDDESVYVDYRVPWFMDVLREVLDTPDATLWLWNAKHDMAVLGNYGLKPAGNVYDAMILSYLVGGWEEVNGGLGLKWQVLHHLGHKMTTWEDLTGKGGKRIYAEACDVPVEPMAEYAADDARQTLRMARLLEPKARELKVWRLFDEVEMPVMWALERMERRGVRVDGHKLLSMGEEMKVEAARIADAWKWETGAMISSPSQVAQRLVHDLGVWKSSKKTAKAKETAVDTSVMQWNAESAPSEWGKELAVTRLRWSKIHKMSSSFCLPLYLMSREFGDGRVHAAFNQAVARTGRLTCSRLQQIPRPGENIFPIREAFIPEDGCDLVDADYEQVEYRIIAHMSEEESLIQDFLDGKDPHQATADRMGISRTAGKTVNFAVLYGLSDRSFAERMGTPVPAASKILKDYWKQHKRIAAFRDRCIDQYRSRGYVRTMLGRVRYIFGGHGAERQAFNTVIQGTAADLAKLGIRNLDRRWEKKGILGKKVWLVLVVHDEYLVECTKDMTEEVVLDMEYILPNVYPGLKVPLPAKPTVGSNWLAAKT